MNEFTPPPIRDDLLWYAIDLDKTLATGTWSIDNPHSIPGPPIQENVEKLKDVIRRGYKVAIHTSRGWADYELIEKWMNHYDIPFDKIICGKLLAFRYVDDRAVNADEESW